MNLLLVVDQPQSNLQARPPSEEEILHQIELEFDYRWVSPSDESKIDLSTCQEDINGCLRKLRKPVEPERSLLTSSGVTVSPQNLCGETAFINSVALFRYALNSWGQVVWFVAPPGSIGYVRDAWGQITRSSVIYWYPI